MLYCLDDVKQHRIPQEPATHPDVAVLESRFST
jgi:hypothetical protein